MVLLRRDILSRGSMVISVNGVIGAWIFVCPAIMTALVGSISPWLFLLGGLVMLPIAVSLGRVAAQMPITGGGVAYAHEAFGPFCGALVGWFIILGVGAGLAAITNILISNLAVFFPVLQTDWGRWCLCYGLWLSLALINFFGVKYGVRVLESISLFKLVPLLVLALTGLWKGQAHIAQIFLCSAVDPKAASVAPSAADWRQAILLTVFAFVGFESALSPGGETRQAHRVLPKILVLTIVTSALFYFAVQTAAILNHPALVGSKAPVPELAGILFGPAGQTTFLIVLALSIFGGSAVGALGHPRYILSMAKNQNLPAVFGRIHPRYQTPWVAIFTSALLIATLAATSRFTFLLNMAILAKLTMYLVSILALTKFAKNPKPAAGGLRGMTGLALAICILLISQVETQAWLCLAAVASFGALFFGGRKLLSKGRAAFAIPAPIVKSSEESRFSVLP